MATTTSGVLKKNGETWKRVTVCEFCAPTNDLGSAVLLYAPPTLTFSHTNDTITLEYGPGTYNVTIARLSGNTADNLQAQVNLTW